jgi:hypothetical protein
VWGVQVGVVMVTVRQLRLNMLAVLRHCKSQIMVLVEEVVRDGVFFMSSYMIEGKQK